MTNKKLNFLGADELEYGEVIVTEDGRRIVKIDGDIPVDLDIKTDSHFLFISHDQSFLTHGLHKYPAKFFPELPRWIIQKFSDRGDFVIDPFAGSGTMNLEALVSERNSVAIDVDPFARLLTKVKVTPVRSEILARSFSWFNAEVPRFHRNIPDKANFPKFNFKELEQRIFG